MPRKPLRSQLNQVRAWVRQGRTDAWIAHQLDVPATELREFRRRHGLEADGEDDSDANEGGQRPKRRRRRRGGRSKRPGAGLQASFDHGEADGYGLWLDPAVTDDPIYSEHWADRRKVEVTIEPDRIVIVPSSD